MIELEGKVVLEKVERGRLEDEEGNRELGRGGKKTKRRKSEVRRDR